MTNFSSGDIHRSLRRYIAEALGEDWSVRLAREVIADAERPAAIVEFSTPVGRLPAARPDRRTIPQGDVGRMAGFAVTAYPPIADLAREGSHEAEQVAQLLDDAITLGLVAEDGTNIGHPGAVPVYDYATVPTTGPGRAGPAEPYGWAVVEDHTVQVLQDPLDEKRWTVPLALRLGWWRAGRALPDQPIATRVPGTFLPFPP